MLLLLSSTPFFSIIVSLCATTTLLQYSIHIHTEYYIFDIVTTFNDGEKKERRKKKLREEGILVANK